MRQRISKNEYYLGIAKAVAQRSTCLRAICGAVIVKNDMIMSTGYSGSASGQLNCSDQDTCERQKLGIKSGERYEMCNSVHGEMNAILQAGKEKSINGIMYVYFERLDELNTFILTPCKMCNRIIINSGLKQVIFREKSGNKVNTNIINY